MKITTLCYIEHDGQYLMLHRIKKENDINEGKFISGEKTHQFRLLFITYKSYECAETV